MTAEGSDLADTYALIYSFLAERSHFKAAEAVRKAANGSIAIAGSQDGPSLPLIVKQWRKFTADQGKKATSPIKSARSESSGSDTSSDSSEDSEPSSEESSASDSEVNLQSSKGSTRPRTKAISSEKVSDPGSDGSTSSDSDSDSDPDNPPREGVKKVAPVLTEEFTRTGKSLGSASLKHTDTPKPLSDEGDDTGSEAHSMSSDGSSSISCSGPGSDNIPISGEGFGQGSGKLQRKGLVGMAGLPTLNFSQNLDGTAVASKKRRTGEGGSSVVTSIVHQQSVSDLRQGWNERNRSRKTNTPFSRVKVGEIKFADERLKDNAFESRMAASNDYGAKANADLVVTRGAGFRKEKNKKKRGSYRGGEITMESHSIKFAN